MGFLSRRTERKELEKKVVWLLGQATDQEIGELPFASAPAARAYAEARRLAPENEAARAGVERQRLLKSKAGYSPQQIERVREQAEQRRKREKEQGEDGRKAAEMVDQGWYLLGRDENDSAKHLFLKAQKMDGLSSDTRDRARIGLEVVERREARESPWVKMGFDRSPSSSGTGYSDAGSTRCPRCGETTSNLVTVEHRGGGRVRDVCESCQAEAMDSDAGYWGWHHHG